MIIYFIAGVFTGILLLWLAYKKPTQVINQKFFTRIGVKPGHLYPQYYGYDWNTFANINKCTSCGLIGLYEDMHESSPCRKCGGKNIRYGAGKFMTLDGEQQWVTPEGPIKIPMDQASDEIEALIKFVNETIMEIGISNTIARGLHGLRKTLGLPRSKQV